MEDRKYPRKNFSSYEENKPANDKDVIFGIRPVIEALEAGKEIDKILIQRNIEQAVVQELFELANRVKVPIIKVPVEKLDRVTRKNHQGVICYLSAINFASLDNIVSACFENAKNPLLVMLDRVTDVRNFGAVARSAECLGVDAMVVPSRGAAQLNSDAVKTSAGALYHIPVCRVDHLIDTVKYLKQCGLRIIACSEKSSKAVYDEDLTDPCVILMGSEEDGIRMDLLRYADAHVTIPMKGHINSLNVSVATGMILSEVTRQRLAAEKK
jgi:23S rRNA (guanosine2251-2'-O)-methyltransferase